MSSKLGKNTMIYKKKLSFPQNVEKFDLRNHIFLLYLPA